MNRQGPRLKNGVDLQLQSAFSDGNWQVAIRLAEKRFRLHNDQYYEVVRICAESQLDDPVAKLAAVSAAWQYAKNGTVLKDVEAIDLLEWATQQLLPEEDFVHTIGPLRARAAKASPKDKNMVTRCLESCLLHWDLNSAQQIAAILDRSFPGGRDFLFWNIVITHLLASSSQSPPEKRKLYGTLAQKQIERAAQAAEQADSAPPANGEKTTTPVKAPARSVQTEEETLLLYDIVKAHGTAEDFEKLVSSATFSPLAQFRKGRKEVLLRAVNKYSRDGKWAAVFELCRECLSETDTEGQPTLLASDYLTWKHLITAAGHLKATKTTLVEETRNLLSTLLASKNMRSMYRRNILLARVSAAFELGPADDDEDVVHGRPSSLRLREMLHYVADQATSAACFNDIKGFLERLDVGGLRYLANEHLPHLAGTLSDPAKVARVNLLVLKVRYFALTREMPPSFASPATTATSTTSSSTEILNTLSELTQSAVKLFKSVGDAEDPGMPEDIVPEIAILIASCSLTRAHLQTVDGRLPPNARRFVLQAVLLLEDQLSKHPVHGQISLMLVQLHLFLGSVNRASEIFEAIGIKRTIVDSLAPIFYDRVSTISPSVLSPNDDWGEFFRDLLRTHYNTSLKMRMPKRLIDAFEAGCYDSVIGMPKYIENLRASSTRVMSLTESKRAERFLGLMTTDLLNDSRFQDVNDELCLTEKVDYGSFPALSSLSSQPLHLSLRLGPAPSNRRQHLELLSETFHDVFLYKPPAVYKVSASAESEQIFVIEMMNRLSNSFGKFLPGPDSDFTPSEIVYFEALSLLSSLVSLCTSTNRSTLPADSLDKIMEALQAALETQRMAVFGKDSAGGVQHTVALVGSMHAVALLRDTLVAIKLATQWITAWSERDKERDRSGKGGLSKDLALGFKSLRAAAEATGKEAQTLVTTLKTEILSRGFEPKLKGWVFQSAAEAEANGDEGGVIGLLSQDTLAEVVESWVVNIKGWGAVVW